MIYLCCDKRRRNAVKAHPVLNGIDFLEVLDTGAAPDTPPQQTLLVRLLKPVPAGLDQGNVIIEGGERISPVRAVWAAPASTPPADLSAAEAAFYSSLPSADSTLVVRTDSSGDYSTYRLRLAASPPAPEPPPVFDPLLSSVDFSFKVECPSDFDCKRSRSCPSPPGEEPEINYLSKDYASFRRLMLDRISQLVPHWRDRSPADLGITLVELLAYVGDHLSYRQDAIATEAYLGTARRRTSVRRHARLVDYPMHDGANARTWVQIQVSADGVSIGRGTRLITAVGEQPVVIAESAPPSELARIFGAHPVVFETLEPSTLFTAHNRMAFYTWGDDRCCLPAGSTRATLDGHLSQLVEGQILVFEEVIGPRTGRVEDADPGHRHAVRLVELTSDAVDPLDGSPVTEVRWHDDDALPFPVCISARTDPQFGGQVIGDVSVARGNIVLADHGHTIHNESLGTVPEPHLTEAEPDVERCSQAHRRPIPARFSPRLAERPLTHAAPLDPSVPVPSAWAVMHWNLRRAVPELALQELGGGSWTPRRDLLSSASGDPHVVAETDSDGITTLRFGDDRNGRRPASGATFTATYRVGNGTAGNVGADSILHIITDTAGITRVRNPLPAAGGVDPEPLEEVRQKAPFAFRVQQRAVTQADYEEFSTQHAAVQRAAATFRWTGSWHTVFVTADLVGGRKVTQQFEEELRSHLERYRMAGYDLEVDGPEFVPLEIELFVCAKPSHFRSDVKAAVAEVLSSGLRASGRPGLFHPDNFTFHQPVYLSVVVAAVQRVEGVQSVEVRVFGRHGVIDPEPLDKGKIPIGRLEIARLDNDPSFPERGVLRLEVGGGK